MFVRAAAFVKIDEAGHLHLAVGGNSEAMPTLDLKDTRPVADNCPATAEEAY